MSGNSYNPCQMSPAPPSAQHQFIAAFDVQVVEIAGFDSRTPLFDGTDIDRTGGKSQTAVTQRALRTAGLCRKTAKSPEIHNGLVVKSRPLPVDQRIGQRSERPPSGSRIDGRIEIVKAGKHPKDIAVECGTGFLVCDRTDRRSRIVAHAGQCPHVGIGRRENAAVRLHDPPGCGQQVPGPGVVAEPLPALENQIFGSRSEGRDVGEQFEKTMIIGHTLRHAGLLQDHFRNPDPVRVPCATPGEVAPLASVPLQEPRSDLGIGNVCLLIVFQNPPGKDDSPGQK